MCHLLGISVRPPVLGRDNSGFFLHSPSLVRVKDPRVQHAVQLEGDVVGRDGALARDLERLLLEALDVGDAVDEGDEDGEAGRQDPVELAHALDDPRRLLRHEPHDGVGRQAGALKIRRRRRAQAPRRAPEAAGPWHRQLRPRRGLEGPGCCYCRGRGGTPQSGRQERPLGLAYQRHRVLAANNLGNWRDGRMREEGWRIDRGSEKEECY